MKLFSLFKKKEEEKAPEYEKLSLGKRGEAAALEYLLSLGYTLKEKNFRHSHSEIDLILKDERCIVFCEVRSQRIESEHYLSPAESVTPSKRANLSEGAEWYMAHYFELSNPHAKTTPPCRFDVVEVFFKDDRVIKINHIKDAFFKTHKKKKGTGYRL